MASSLVSPHWEATPPDTRQLLETIGAFSFRNRFYLGGGTALALRLGHRVSHDLDFFSDTDRVDGDTRAEILADLRRAFPDLEIATDTIGDLTVSIFGKDVGFYSYRYQMLEPGDDLLGTRVAGLLDIAAMKLDAIAGRGLRRDFYDLYFLAQRFTLESLFERAKQKYPYSGPRDFPMIVMPYLNDFTNADIDKPVATLPPVSWEEVRAFFLAEAQRLAKVWFLPTEEEEEEHNDE